MKAWRFAFGALLMSSAGAGAAAPATGPNSAFGGSDLFNLAMASDPKISPDGRQIAYVRKSNDVMTDKARSSIWLIDVATGRQRDQIGKRDGILAVQIGTGNLVVGDAEGQGP